MKIMVIEVCQLLPRVDPDLSWYRTPDSEQVVQHLSDVFGTLKFVFLVLKITRYRVSKDIKRINFIRSSWPA